MDSKSGFSLLEVIVVIAVLGVLVGYSGPRIMEYYHWLKLQGVVNQLISDCHLARRKSAAGNKKWGIIFLPDQDKYLLVEGKQSPAIKKRLKLSGKVEYKRITFPPYQGQPAVYFKQLGNLDTPNGTVVLQQGSKQKKIVFSSNAGEINVR